MKNNNFIRHVPCLRKSIVYDDGFCYTSIKWWYRKRARNGQRWQIMCLLQLMPQESYIIWLPFMVHLCKMIMSPWAFFIFSKCWFSGLLGVKGQETAQNDKKLCLPCLIYQEPYIMIVICSTQVQSDNTSRHFFFFFCQNFSFLGF